MSVSAPPIPMTMFATDAYAYLEPVAGADPDNDWVLYILCGALGSAFGQVEELCRPVSPSGHPAPYQNAYDVNTCPDWLLGWLGQFVGVPYTAYTDENAKREQVRAETGFYRGSVPNLLAAAQAQQTAPNRTTVIERSPDAWGIEVAYDPEYTPDVDAYTRAVQAAVAWALALTVTSVSQPLFRDATLNFEAESSAVTFENATLAEVT